MKYERARCARGQCGQASSLCVRFAINLELVGQLVDPMRMRPEFRVVLICLTTTCWLLSRVRPINFTGLKKFAIVRDDLG